MAVKEKICDTHMIPVCSNCKYGVKYEYYSYENP